MIWLLAWLDSMVAFLKCAEPVLILQTDFTN